MSSDINVQTFSGKVNITSNLLVGTSHLFVDTINNRVGLVTNTPDAGLHVNSNAYVHTDFRVGSGIVMNDTAGQITAGSFVGDGSAMTGINSDSGSWVNGANSNVHLATSTDKVGIGTTSPATKLHVEHYGSAIGDFEGIRIANHASLLHATVRPAYEFVVSDINSATGIGNGKFAIGYRATTSASRTDRLVIDNSGNVGIGTVDPKSVLHVSGDTPKLAIADNTEDDCDVNGFSTGIAFVDNTWNGSMLYSQNPAAGMGFYLGHLSSSSKEVNMKNLTGELSFGTRNVHQAMYIDNDGNVGIGTTNTHGAKFLVNGTMGTYMSGSTVANRFYVYNNSYAAPVVNQIHLSLRNYNATAPSHTQADRKSGFWFGQYNDQNYTNGEQFIGFTDKIRFIKCDSADYAGSIVYDSNTFNAKINGNLQTRLGSIDSSSTSNPINFTGQHRCVVENFDTNLEGLIVSANKSEYCSMSNGLKRGLKAVTVNEALPIVTLSRTCMDKSCFGVISLSEDPENETREDRFGCFVAEFEKEEGDERVYINSVGEGAIWVTNINGPLESGDYITTSIIPGYGQRQNDDILHNYTVAKITMNCDFEPDLQNVKKIKKNLVEEKLWYKNENTEIDYQEYLTISDEKKYTFVEDGKTKYMKTIKRYSKEKIAEYDLEEVSEIMKNILDEHGQLQWEDTEETEKAYKIRYLLPNGTQISEEEYTTRALAGEKVYIAAFVGCTYHCG